MRTRFSIFALAIAVVLCTGPVQSASAFNVAPFRSFNVKIPDHIAVGRYAVFVASGSKLWAYDFETGRKSLVMNAGRSAAFAAVEADANGVAALVDDYTYYSPRTRAYRGYRSVYVGDASVFKQKVKLRKLWFKSFKGTWGKSSCGTFATDIGFNSDSTLAVVITRNPKVRGLCASGDRHPSNRFMQYDPRQPGFSMIGSYFTPIPRSRFRQVVTQGSMAEFSQFGDRAVFTGETPAFNYVNLTTGETIDLTAKYGMSEIVGDFTSLGIVAMLRVKRKYVDFAIADPNAGFENPTVIDHSRSFLGYENCGIGALLLRPSGRSAEVSIYEYASGVRLPVTTLPAARYYAADCNSWYAFTATERSRGRVKIMIYTMYY